MSGGPEASASPWRDRLQQAPEWQRGPLLMALLHEEIRERLGLEPWEVTPRGPFAALGMTSLQATELKVRLEAMLGLPLRSSLAFDYPNLETLVPFLLEQLGFENGAALPTRETAMGADLESAVRALRERVAELEGAAREPLAVIGMGCRFPGGIQTADDYWRLLASGRDGLEEIPPDRWDNAAYYDPRLDAPGKVCTPRGGFLGPVEPFDAAFFRISPREAMYMDPQHRLLLEVAWEALEHANLPPDGLYGSDAGVFVGISSLDYSNLVVQEVPETMVDPWFGTGVAHSAASGRISYALGLQGPCLSIDTACSSSLVAVQLACESLRRRECSLALVGGVNLILSPLNHITFSRARMLAPDGRCKTFDDAADGYVRSEGAGIVVLKRLSDALADGNRVWAVVRGAAVNQDGPSGGLTVPNGPAQQAVIRKALANAGVEPADVGYVEAHGTGTALGDPIEVNALAEVFQATHDKARPLLVGSAKTNLGHMEPAAGVGGLIKLVLQLQRGLIAPHLHLSLPSRRIPWHEVPLEVPTRLVPWPRYGESRVGGVSSFGFSGTNAHVVVEEAPPLAPAAEAPARSRHILCLSAKTESALATLRERYAALLAEPSSASLADACRSAGAGRSHFEHRLAVVCASAEDAVRQLRANGESSSAPAALPARMGQGGPALAFLFTGQGSQIPGMGRELYDTQPAFRAELDRCDDVLRAELGGSLVAELYTGEASAEQLKQTGWAQPLIVSLELALAALWRSWGVQPDYVAGHSVGELAAACLAGVMSREDALRLVAARGRLMQALGEPGGMIAADCDEGTAREAIRPYASRVSIAAVNAPSQTVLSGARVELDEVMAVLQACGVRCRSLEVSHAFHSPLMEPMLEEFAAAAARVAYSPPRLGLVSNVSGQLAGEEVARSDYWVRHVLEPVRFRAGIEALYAQGCRTFLELGPQPVLTLLGARSIEDPSAAWLASLDPRRGAWEQMLASLGALYERGRTVDWEAFYRGSGCGHATLPAYPFERRPYWFRPGPRGKKAGRATLAHPLLGRPTPPLDDEPPETQAFESEVSENNPAYLRDHRIFDHALLPGAGFVELALAAAAAIAPGESFRIEDFTIEAPLLLEDDHRRLRTRLNPLPDGAFAVTVASAEPGEGGEWVTHARCFVSPHAAGGGQAEAHDDGAFEELDPEVLYADAARDRGITYGPSFKAIRNVLKGDRVITGTITLPPDVAAGRSAYVLHPVMLDAAFHLFGPVLPDKYGTYLPVRTESIEYLADPGPQSAARLALHPDEGREGALRADIEIRDAAGAVAVRIKGMHVLRTTEAALRRALEGDLSGLLYQFEWKEQPLPERPVEVLPRRWLILADEEGVGAALAAELEREHGTCTVVTARANARYDALASAEAGIVYLWALDTPPLTEPAASDGLLGCGPLLDLAKALGESSKPVPLTLVTRGAVFTDPRQTASNPQQAAVVGLLRTIQAEAPALRCRHVDLDPMLERRTLAGEAARLAHEALQPDRESHVALRAHQRLVLRLERQRAPVAEAGPVQVWLREYGSPDDLTLVPAERRDPGPGEVEIAVRAAGLNFKDVLHTWGLLRAHAAEHGLPWVDRRRLGFECSGVVTRCGEGVDGLAPGDEVIGMGSECLSHYVTLPSRSVMAKPKRLDFAEAAGLPAAYVTAYYSLVELAKVQPGDTVLVHAAAGGVGQAALRLCRHLGAEVFATASPAKADFVRAQGVRAVMNSRTLDFKDELQELTGGRGVDVVLNSLTGEFIPASFEVLARGGRFVEIGKRGIWPAERVAEARPDASYFTFDLGETSAPVADRLPRMLRQVCAWIEAGHLEALPVQVFPAERVRDAFRLLAQAKSVGKVVVEFAEPTAAGALGLRPDAAYLVTGGLGGLGLEVAEWLAQQGARHLALLGRSAPTEDARRRLSRLEQAGVAVACLQADVASMPDLEKVRGALTQPLRGVVHAAGVLDDGLLTEQTRERFRKVMAPKVAGTWNLHQVTEDAPLDFFVCFSSIAAALGSPGQAAYAAGNAFMDALMEQRRAAGRPGLSVAYGPWASVGMAARLDPALRNLVRWRGLDPLSPRRALRLLGRSLEASGAHAHVVAAGVRWATFLDRLNQPHVPSYLESLAGEAGGPGAQAAGDTSREPGELRATWEQAAAAEGPTLLLAHLLAVLAKVLRFSSPDEIDSRRGFFDLGLDSLSALEVKGRMETALNTRLPATLLMDFATPEALVGHLHAVLSNEAAELAQAAQPAAV